MAGSGFPNEDKPQLDIPDRAHSCRTSLTSGLTAIQAARSVFLLLVWGKLNAHGLCGLSAGVWPAQPVGGHLVLFCSMLKGVQWPTEAR